MANSYRDDSHLDAAIDRAVRDMMSAEPRTDLRERVLAELTGAPARVVWWPRLALGSAALAVAAVAMLVLVDHPADRPVERVAVATPAAESPRLEPPAPATPPRTTPAPADRTPVRGDGPKTAPAPRGRAAADRPIQAASVDPGEAIGIEPMTPVERLAPIEPLGMSTLDAPLVATAAINIAPITINRIEMTTLKPPQ
jgi:hypothetical protein